ncbi:MAG: CHASE2 domain-containing protein [Burkholderiales bacterium]
MRKSWAMLANVLVVATISAAICWIPASEFLERNIGLGWLFRLRGPIGPPGDIVLITIGTSAAANIFLPNDAQRFHRCEDIRFGVRPSTHLGLPSMPSRWPRCLHAVLIDKLAKAGARTIVFDVLFRPRPPLPGFARDPNADQDAQLGATMARSRGVLIAQKLESSGAGTDIAEEHLIELSAAIDDAALGAAPFPVIGDSERRFDRFLAFKDPGWATPSLASLAVQAYTLDSYSQFRGALQRVAPDAAQWLPADAEEIRRTGRLQASVLLMRQIFTSERELATRMRAALEADHSLAPDPATRAQIDTLIDFYAGDSVRLLNFFGPAGTIPALGFDEALAMNDEEASRAFHGKAVIVGYAELAQPEQVDHFNTVFSTAAGLELSGMEIVATAFANLLHGDTIRPTAKTTWTLVALLAGLICTALCLWLPNRVAFPALAALVLGYGAIAYSLFAKHSLWLPVVIPMFVSAPLGLGAGTLWKYEMARRQRNRIRDAFAQFVPKEVVDGLIQNAQHVSRTRESVECACVATDAANFTALAETMSPEQLADFLNVYFEALFRPIPKHGGFVSDVVGDALLAIWPNRTPETRRHVCAALLEMREAADQFNQRLASNRLATRFGVDWGRVVLTTVGAHRHYEYRAVGDPVNTANRIQDLNKKLGTRVLVSEPAVEGLENFLLREVGYFFLRGKALPVHAFELIGLRETAGPNDLVLCERFARALALLRKGESAEALEAFRKLAGDSPGDGPSAFYVRVLESGAMLRDGALKVD